MAKKPTKRRAFNFLRSYYDVLNELSNDKDKLNFLLSILNKQFIDEDPKGLNFIVNICYESQRHHIEQSVNGYKQKMKTDLLGSPIEGGLIEHIEGGIVGGTQGGSQAPLVQEKEKEKVIYIKSITSPPEGVAPLYFYIAKGFHNLFLKKGETKTLNNASLTKWVEDTRKIIEVDKVPISQLIAIKRYWEECESGARGTDNFWFNTINSMSSFRKIDKDGVYHYDKITTSVKKWLNANPELQGEIFKIEQNLIAKSNGN